MVYTFTYFDCSGHSHARTYTYTTSAPDYTLPPHGSSTVNCPANAVLPTAPAVTDACGNTITPTVVEMGRVSCRETMVYTVDYVDCEGNSHGWKDTYTISTSEMSLTLA